MMFAGNDKKPVGGHILAHAYLPPGKPGPAWATAHLPAQTH
jgi:hypothetical protein